MCVYIYILLISVLTKKKNLAFLHRDGNPIWILNLALRHREIKKKKKKVKKIVGFSCDYLCFYLNEVVLIDVIYGHVIVKIVKCIYRGFIGNLI